MPYDIRMPDGTVVRNIPDDVEPSVAKQRLSARRLGPIAGAVDNATGNMLTKQPERDLPELGELYPQMYPRLSLGRDDAAKSGIFERIGPGGQVSGSDTDGNVIVNTPRGPAYLNRPGLSTQDAADLLPAIGAEALGAKGAGLALRPLARLGGRVMDVIGDAAGVGAGSIGQDVAAGAAGSQAGVDATSAQLSAAFAGGGSAASRFIGYVTDTLRSGRRLSAPERQAVQQAGFDPDAITDNAIRVSRRMPNATTEELAEMVVLQSHRPPIPPTRSMLTRNPLDAAEELQALNSSDNVVQSVARSRRDAVDDAFMGNINQVRREIGGGIPDEAPRGVSGEAIQDALVQRRAGDQQAARAAYDALEDSDLRIQGGRDALVDRLTQVADDFTFPEAIDRQIRRLEGMGDDPRLFKDIEQLRQRANSVPPTSDAAPGARAAVQVIDEMIEGAVFRGDVLGSADDVARLKEARSLYREFKQTYDNDPFISQLTKQARNGELAVAPERVFNKILGKAYLGSTGAAAGDIRKIRDLVGADSDAFNGLREEALVQMLKGRNGTVDLSGFANRFFTADNNAQPVLKELFGDQYGRIKELAAVGRRYINPPAETNTNPSGSGRWVTTMLESWFGRTGTGTVNLLSNAMTKSGLVSERREALSMLRGQLPFRPQPSSVAPAVFGSQGSQIVTEDRPAEARN